MISTSTSGSGQNYAIAYFCNLVTNYLRLIVTDRLGLTRVPPCDNIKLLDNLVNAMKGYPALSGKALKASPSGRRESKPDGSLTVK